MIFECSNKFWFFVIIEFIFDFSSGNFWFKWRVFSVVILLVRIWILWLEFLWEICCFSVVFFCCSWEICVFKNWIWDWWILILVILVCRVWIFFCRESSWLVVVWGLFSSRCLFICEFLCVLIILVLLKMIRNSRIILLKVMLIFFFYFLWCVFCIVYRLN